MLNIFKQLAADQFEAALRMLEVCIDRCPESAWNGPVVNYKFCQTAFHTLFYADYYLGPDAASFREQAFHRDHAQFFDDYEEFEDRAPMMLYDKAAVKAYLEFCRSKLTTALAAETEESLQARAEFPRRHSSRAELYVYNIRHIQHHVAQLSMRLRIDATTDMPWIASGWRAV